MLPVGMVLDRYRVSWELYIRLTKEPLSVETLEIGDPLDRLTQALAHFSTREQINKI